MVSVLVRDAESLRAALRREGDEVQVTVLRETAELIAKVADARVAGQEVVISKGRKEVSPQEAAVLLGMSRPQVRRLIDRGELPARLVGSHHRIALADVEQFDRTERERRARAAAAQMPDAPFPAAPPAGEGG